MRPSASTVSQVVAVAHDEELIRIVGGRSMARGYLLQAAPQAPLRQFVYVDGDRADLEAHVTPAQLVEPAVAERMGLIAEVSDLDEQVVVCVDDHRPTPLHSPSSFRRRHGPTSSLPLSRKLAEPRRGHSGDAEIVERPADLRRAGPDRGIGERHERPHERHRHVELVRQLDPGAQTERDVVGEPDGQRLAAIGVRLRA